MDETHRLKPMAQGYDEDVFVQIYEDTQRLRNKLAFEIDNRRFGVDKQEILSWFDVKFIHAYNKFLRTYGSEDEGNLKGYIINSLKQYKNRVLRTSYQKKYIEHHHILDITELIDETQIESNPEEVPQIFLQKALEFIKDSISDNALMILELELNPPEWVKREIEDLGKKQNTKIPSYVIAEYLGLPNTPNIILWINSLRKEANHAIELAHNYFSKNPIII